MLSEKDIELIENSVDRYFSNNTPFGIPTVEYTKYVLEGLLVGEEVQKLISRTATLEFNKSNIELVKIDLYIEKFMEILLTRMENNCFKGEL